MAGSGRENANSALLAALAGGKSIQGAAKLCGVSEQTVRRRMRSPEFKQELSQARSAMLARAIGHLAAGSTESSITLRKLLKSSNEKIKLGAARSILELGVKMRENVEMAEELRLIKQRLDEVEGQR